MAIIAIPWRDVIAQTVGPTGIEYSMPRLQNLQAGTKWTTKKIDALGSSQHVGVIQMIPDPSGSFDMLVNEFEVLRNMFYRHSGARGLAHQVNFDKTVKFDLIIPHKDECGIIFMTRYFRDLVITDVSSGAGTGKEVDLKVSWEATLEAYISGAIETDVFTGGGAGPFNLSKIPLTIDGEAHYGVRAYYVTSGGECTGYTVTDLWETGVERWDGQGQGADYVINSGGSFTPAAAVPAAAALVVKYVWQPATAGFDPSS